MRFSLSLSLSTLPSSTRPSTLCSTELRPALVHPPLSPLLDDMARFAGARPYGMLREVPVPATSGPPATMVVVACPGASTPRAFLKAPLLEMARESGLFATAYILDMAHVWLYGLDDAGQPVALAGGVDDQDIPTAEEATALHEAALCSVLDREPHRRVVILAYSMSAILTLRVWPRVRAYAAALGRPTPATVLVGTSTHVPDWKQSMIADYFSPQGLTDAGKYEGLRRVHGPHYDVILRCTRRWCAGEPLLQSTAFFDDTPGYRIGRVTDPNVHFVMGHGDYVYEVADLFGPLTPPPVLLELSEVTAEADVVQHLHAACAAHLPAQQHAPRSRPTLSMVPGDHFAMLAGEGFPAARASVHLALALIDGTLTVPRPYAAAARL